MLGIRNVLLVLGTISKISYINGYTMKYTKTLKCKLTSDDNLRSKSFFAYNDIISLNLIVTHNTHTVQRVGTPAKNIKFKIK